MSRQTRAGEYDWSDDGNVVPQRKRKARKNDVHEGSVPIAKPGSNQFVAQTWRFFFYALFLCGAGASLAFFTPVPFLVLPVAMAAMFISLFTFILLHYAFENYSAAFYAFLFFAATFGIVLGPQLVLIAATVQNGMFIICAAAAATAGMTLALHNYAWFKASFSLRRISLLGSFLSTALTGLIILGLISLIFPTPLGMLLYGAAGVAVFSLYLVYDVYLLKIGAFSSPVEAAMNLFLDVMNLFLEMLRIFIAVQSEKSELANFGDFFWKRVLPLVGIALIVLSFGLLERWVMKDWHGIDDDVDDSDYYSPPPSAPSQGRLQPNSARSAPELLQGQAPEDQNEAGVSPHSQSVPGKVSGTGNGKSDFFGNSQPQVQNGPAPSAPPLYQPVYPQTPGAPLYHPQQYAGQGQFFQSQQSTGQNQQAYQGSSQFQQTPSVQGYTPAFVSNMSGGQGNNGSQNYGFPPPPYNPALYQGVGAPIPPPNYYQ